MQQRRDGKIVLKRCNWELPALISLMAAVGASLYAVTSCFNAIIVAGVYVFSLLSGFVSIINQIQASKATIVTFTKDDWIAVEEGGDKGFALEIESDFMLFRVETRKVNNSFEEVVSGIETTEDGKITRIYFSEPKMGQSLDEYLAGRIVVR